MVQCLYLSFESSSVSLHVIKWLGSSKHYKSYGNVTSREKMAKETFHTIFLRSPELSMLPCLWPEVSQTHPRPIFGNDKGITNWLSAPHVVLALGRLVDFSVRKNVDRPLKLFAIRPYFLFDPFYLFKLLVVFLVLREFRLFKF